MKETLWPCIQVGMLIGLCWVFGHWFDVTHVLLGIIALILMTHNECSRKENRLIGRELHRLRTMQPNYSDWAEWRFGDDQIEQDIRDLQEPTRP